MVQSEGAVYVLLALSLEARIVSRETRHAMLSAPCARCYRGRKEDATEEAFLLKIQGKLFIGNISCI